ncbi:aldehyde dehydrogenase [Talaromyces proteolyticus]|uniref:aldehyde dehydrogenase (NAD(+)) n=1 Tax=Talaromyces proteolyticus TaxID=1131652 RepID=A0AAD4PRP1_9EURO|nr:aldehyde dehydrogenase [Talaromyces proteolyticus]KAH8689339.1 aldehyde dehydrogenase [Talaromyces proteolyticus]
MASFQFSATNLPTQLFVNNEYVPAKNAKTFSVLSPKDGSLVSDKVPLADKADVDRAVDAAEAAFPAWRAVSAVERREIMLKFASLLDQHSEALAELSRITQGAPYLAWGKFEIAVAAEAFRYYAGWIDKFQGDAYPEEDGFLKITRHEPLGVTAGIVPWNGPLGSAGTKMAPALATGNTFILKPSEKTPFASLGLGPLIKEAGFPPGVLQVLSGDGSTGALLASHMRIRKISFTGSIPTGKRIQQYAAESNLKRVTLELGGKSPAIIFDDANLDNTVSWCVNAIAANTGQICFAASRIYVQEGIKEKFLEKYKAALQERGQATGDPDQPTTLMGPLVDEAQFKRVTGFIERGASQGTLILGGKRIGNSGFFVEPTLFADVPQDAEIYQQEIFGPVGIVNTFKTEGEVIKKANATEYGLMAGIFTQDINRALRVSSALDSGMVGVNLVSRYFLNAPFGGTKQSGIGRENGRAALEAFTDTKTVMVNLTY